MAIDSFIFGGNTGLTYEQLKRRRAVAAALAAQRRGYPKTVGEGLTYLGESIGDTLAERRLDAAEQEMQARRDRLMGGVPGAAPATAPPSAAGPGIPPAAPRPPTPPRSPVAPVSPRPAPPASAAAPMPVLPSGPSSEAMTSGPPPSEFAMGGILNAAPMGAPNLEPVFPGEEGIPSQAAGILPSSGYLSPAATAAAPPPNLPAPTAAPTEPNYMDEAGWPTGPRRDLLSTETGAPISPRPPEAVSPELQRAQEFQRQQGRPVTGPTGAPLGAPAPRPQSLNLTPEQRDVLARTVYGEASNQDDIGQQAVANVILNRARLAGTAPDYEALKKNQFEPWWNAKARARMERLSTEDPAYRRAQAAVDAALSGDDPTQGATHFYSPSVQAALGRRMPSWDTGGGQMIGTHKFLQLPYGGRQPDVASEEAGGGNIRLAAYAPSGGVGGAPIPGMGGAGAPRLAPSGAEEQVTPTDIEPAPSTAQFGPPTNRFTRSDAPVAGIPPAPSAAPMPSAPVVSPQVPQGPQRPTVSDDLIQPLPEPTPPAYPDKLTPEEEYGWRLQAAAGGDPEIQARAKQWIDNGKAKRDAQYLREVELYKQDITFVRQENAARLKYQREAPETEQKLRKGESELAKEQQAREQSRLSPGPSAAPGALGTPASPQRTGVPGASPVPAGVSPQKWGEIEAPRIAAKVDAADKATADVSTVLDRIDQVRKHPGKSTGLGLQGEIAGNIKGSDAYGFRTIVGELKGKSFLQAYQSLKGGGAISEKEGEKAEQAIARINTAQNERDFNRALLDLENIVRGDLERAQRAVNKPVTAWREPGDSSSFAPDIGQGHPKHPGWHYTGGNPAEPSSWAKR